METARTALNSGFAAQFDTFDIRVVQLGGFNVEVWIPRRNFDSVNYLDRKAFVETSGGAWCSSADGWTSPTLTVRDAGTAKALAVFHCTFRYSDMNPN
jgi:hypothetical protein